jgi:DNA-binding transcriptional LysR family regulator
MIVQFALRNLGVGCVVRDFAREYLEDGRLFELRFNRIIPKRHICVATNPRNPLSAAARNMLALLQEMRGL